VDHDKLHRQPIQNCIACQDTVECKNTEPLKMTELPYEPWRELSVDFCGPFPSGDCLMVVIDEYSRYPEVIQFCISFSTSLSIPGNQTFSRSNDFVFTIPWCPSCASFTTRFRNYQNSIISENNTLFT
jgi:hypothetical protein